MGANLEIFFSDGTSHKIAGTIRDVEHLAEIKVKIAARRKKTSIGHTCIWSRPPAIANAIAEMTEVFQGKIKGMEMKRLAAIVGAAVALMSCGNVAAPFSVSSNMTLLQTTQVNDVYTVYKLRDGDGTIVYICRPNCGVSAIAPAKQ